MASSAPPAAGFCSLSSCVCPLSHAACAARASRPVCVWIAPLRFAPCLTCDSCHAFVRLGRGGSGGGVRPSRCGGCTKAGWPCGFGPSSSVKPRGQLIETRGREEEGGGSRVAWIRSVRLASFVSFVVHLSTGCEWRSVRSDRCEWCEWSPGCCASRVGCGSGGNANGVKKETKEEK